MSQATPAHFVDVEVLERFRNGDANAFQRLHIRFAPGLQSFLAARLSSSGDDAHQQVWMKAWEARESFVGGDFRAWLFTIARNIIKDHWRKKKTSEMPEEFEPVAPAQIDGGEERLEALRGCLEFVSGQFVAVIKAMLNGLSVPQIAQQFSIAENTVYTRIDRGKKQLAECLKRKLT